MHHQPPGQNGERGAQYAALASTLENNLQAQVFVLSACCEVRTRWANLLAAGGHCVSGFAHIAELAQLARPEAPLCLVQDHDGGALPPADLRQLAGSTNVPPAWVVMLAADAPVATAVGAMRAGAFDVLARGVADAVLLDTVNEAIARQRVARQMGAPRALVAQRHAGLTPRERQVFALVCEGKRNREMADILQLSEISIKMHRSNVMRKMGVRTLADLVRAADLLK